MANRYTYSATNIYCDWCSYDHAIRNSQRTPIHQSYGSINDAHYSTELGSSDD